MIVGVVQLCNYEPLQSVAQESTVTSSFSLSQIQWRHKTRVLQGNTNPVSKSSLDTADIKNIEPIYDLAYHDVYIR